MTQYETYDGGSDDDLPWELRDDEGTAERVAGGWAVIAEYSNGGERKPPTVVAVLGRALASREEALASAQEEAFSFDPPDPLSPRGRQVYRDGPDGFLVVIEGAMSTFHMSVRVVQHLGDA